MLYPEEFKQKVIAAFPENDDVKLKLENGDESLGQFLFDSTLENTISIYAVINACENVKYMADLYNKCKKIAYINSLYNEYTNLKSESLKRTNR